MKPGTLIKIVCALEKYQKVPRYHLKVKRKPVPYDASIQDIPLLQEIAYIDHRDEILAYQEVKKKEQKKERLGAIKNKLVKTCSCCYDEEVLPRNIVTCVRGCLFCSDCVQKSVEILFGEGKLDFPCLANCDSHFSLQTLKVNKYFPRNCF